MSRSNRRKGAVAAAPAAAPAAIAAHTNGGAMVQYHRSLVFSPKLVTGPVSGDGLYNELRMFMLGGDDDEPEPTAATNGAQEVRQ